ncbi:MAG: transcription termination factor Rho [Lachnospiraceae bacterium]|nr:transcription termination factor Rho [Lachnospiraceae bacterium]
MEKYLEMTITQLREEAKKRGLKGTSAMKKQELSDLLSASDRASEPGQKAKKIEAAPAKVTQKVSAVQETRGKTAETSVGKRPQGSTERSVQAKPYGMQERPNMTKPQGGQEHQSMPKPREQQERQRMEKMQGLQENQTFAKPQSSQNSSGTPKKQGSAERPAQARPQQAEARTPQTEVKPQQPDVRMQQSEVVAEVSQQRFDPEKATPDDIKRLDSGDTRVGILEVMSENFGFIRCDNYLPGENDVYVSPAQIRKYGLKTGDIICGNTKIRMQNEKFSALLYIKNVNGLPVEEIIKRKRFEDLTPIFPNERIHLETPGCSLSMRMVDLISPIGKGQRGMIVSQPKTGKTTLLKQIAKAITKNHPEMNMIILLIDERPEEVTDIKESIEGDKVEVIYSTFDELPENHKRVSEMVIERAKRLVEQKQDVVILLDSITRLARAYNLTVAPSGRTLSGGLDPAALHMPKKFFGAARNMREGGSLTILATALVDTGSRMDDVVFEEFKGTGNMELQLDRNLSERRVFPAIDLPRSSTRRDDLLLTKEEQEATALMRRLFNGAKAEESIENIMRTFQSTKNNAEFVQMIKKYR